MNMNSNSSSVFAYLFSAVPPGDDDAPPPPTPGGKLTDRPTDSSMDEEQEAEADKKGEDDADDWLRLRLAAAPPPPATTDGGGGGPSSSSIRVVGPARSCPAGVWLILQADRTRGELHPDPFPQIGKSYLRIRDGGMTVRLLIKYIVNKLRLNQEEEAEVEITCRNQVLHPSLTLQYVRDNIWRARDAVLLLPDLSNIDHVMRLLFRRRTSGITR